MVILAAGTDPSPAQPLLVHNSSASLAGECADLRIELARRDAEIESLQGALAAAAASQQDSLAPYLLTRDDASAEQVGCDTPPPPRCARVLNVPGSTVLAMLGTLSLL